MRRASAALLCLALGCAPSDDAAARRRHVVVEDAAPMTLGELAPSSLDEPERDPVAIANALETRTEGTYLPELLEMRAGWSYRWADRRLEPMRVWIAPSSIDAYEPDFARAVEAAFNDWAEIGLPFVFTFRVAPTLPRL